MHNKYLKAERRFTLRWPEDVQLKTFVELQAVHKE